MRVRENESSRAATNVKMCQDRMCLSAGSPAATADLDFQNVEPNPRTPTPQLDRAMFTLPKANPAHVCGFFDYSACLSFQGHAPGAAADRSPGLCKGSGVKCGPGRHVSAASSSDDPGHRIAFVRRIVPGRRVCNRCCSRIILTIGN